MTITQHTVVKPKVLLEAAVEALSENLIVSNLVTRRTDFAPFFGAEGDTISQRVEGTLPVRLYGVRNDRSKPIVTDTYKETVVNVTIDAERPYSATRLTDEQRMWDFNDGWARLINAQTKTLGNYLEHSVLTQILGAPVERVIKVDDSATVVKAAIAINQDVYFNAIVDATTSLDRMRVPGGEQLIALCGYEFANRIVKSNRLVVDHGAGAGAFSSAVLGTMAGVTFVVDRSVPAMDAIMFAKSAFVSYNATAPVPDSVKQGATINKDGYALRWLQDYESSYLSDRSVFDTFHGSAYTRDRISVFDGVSQNVIDDKNEYFVRAIKLTVDPSATAKEPGDGKDDTPGGDAKSFLALAYHNKFTEVPSSPGAAWYPLAGNFPTDSQPEPPVGGKAPVEGP